VPDPAATFERREVDGERTLCVSGEIDIDNAEKFRAQLWAAMRESHSPAVVDLSEVHFIDSSGVAVLLDAHEHAPTFDSRLVLVSPSSPCRRVLELLGLMDVLEIRNA